VVRPAVRVGCWVGWDGGGGRYAFFEGGGGGGEAAGEVHVLLSLGGGDARRGGGAGRVAGERWARGRGGMCRSQRGLWVDGDEWV
jgi:hypothetical protein